MIDPITLATNLIRCPSVTPEDHGALGVMQTALESLGFTCTRLPFSESGHPTVDNLYARLGTVGPHLAFAGHTDVVPVGDAAAWSVEPFGGIVKDGFLYGRGAEDMKTALACMVSAVATFLSSSLIAHRSSPSISFIITGDEEGYAINGTRKMVKWMQERGIKPDACIVGEPTNPEHIGDMVKIGRRGSLSVKLIVRGKQGHAAYPHLADNPVTRLIDIVHELKHTVIDQGTDFFQPSNLEITSIDVGNPVKNVIPAQATANVNIRFNDRHSSESMLRWLDEVATTYAPGAFAWETLSAFEPFLTPPGRLSTIMSEAVQAATGRTPQLSTTGGTSDARFIKDICPVAEFGTTGGRAHMVDERVSVDDVRLLTNCYVEVLQRFFG